MCEADSHPSSVHEPSLVLWDGLVFSHYFMEHVMQDRVIQLRISRDGSWRKGS